jgi:two-component sensor histidine kinase
MNDRSSMKNGNPRILVVDDEEGLVTLAARVLREEGFEVEGAATGKEAMEKLRSWGPGIVLLDVMLPDTSGYDLCRLIHREMADKDIMVILTSGLMVSDNDRAKGIESGAIQYLSKPVGLKELRAAVRGIANLRSSRLELQDRAIERELLLKKLHHRVKNDLILIESLIELREDSITDPKARDLIADMRSKIRGIAAVHECMYRSGDIEAVDARSYFRELSLYLPDLLLRGRKGIALVVQSDECSMDADRALNLGLIAAELVSNAVKHGFPKVDSGTIRLSFESRETEIVLTVEDDGLGLVEGVEAVAAAVSGLALVRLMAESQGGSLILASSRPARFEVRMPIDRRDKSSS